MDGKFKETLRDFSDELQHKVNFSDIHENVSEYNGGFLKRNDWIRVRNKHNSEESIRVLIECLLEMDVKAFKAFCEVLAKMGYSKVALRMREHAGLKKKMHHPKDRQRSGSYSHPHPRRLSVLMEQQRGSSQPPHLDNRSSSRSDLAIAAAIKHAQETGTPYTVTQVTVHPKSQPQLTGSDDHSTSVPFGDSSVNGQTPDVHENASSLYQEKPGLYQEKPDQTHLDWVARNVGDKWRTLLTMLGVDFAIVEECYEKYHNNEVNTCFAVLANWSRGKIETEQPISYGTLFDALRKADVKMSSELENEVFTRSPTKHAQLPPAVVTDGRHPLEWGDDVVTSSSESTSSHNDSGIGDRELWVDPRSGRSSSVEGSAECLKEFFEMFNSKFKDVVDAKAIATKLTDKEVLPPAVEKEIMKANDKSEKRILLWKHIVDNFTYNATVTLCEVMKNEVGYPRMNILGKEMLKALKEES